MVTSSLEGRASPQVLTGQGPEYDNAKSNQSNFYYHDHTMSTSLTVTLGLCRKLIKHAENQICTVYPCASGQVVTDRQ